MSLSRKIRVAHYCNQLGVGGTERTMEIFCRNLDKNRYEVFAVAKKFRPRLLENAKVQLGCLIGNKKAKAKKKLWDSLQSRTPNFISILGNDHVLFANDDEDLKRLLLSLNLDILHVHYSGAPELPTSDEELMTKIPVVITTNPFERENTAPSHRHVKRILFVSEWLWKNKATWAKEDSRAGVLYNPIEIPLSNENLRKELNIPETAFVVGRVGRPDPGIHDRISLEAYKLIEDDNTYFLALSPPNNMVEDAKRLSLKNFISVPATTDSIRLSKFYNTIDVLAHARRDGETFGCNIAEAMIHGKPVISHLSEFMNAQTEIIGDAGFVVELGDTKGYGNALSRLKTHSLDRSEFAQKAKHRAFKEFESQMITRKLDEIYQQSLKQ